NRLSIKIFFIFLIGTALFVCPPLNSPAQKTSFTAGDTTGRFDQYSYIYYQNKSREYSAEIIPLEKYLQFLIKSVNYQLRTRKDIPLSAVESVNSDEISHLAAQKFDSKSLNPYAQKYEIWRKYQDNEINMNIARILTIKRRIMESGSRGQKSEMFKRDIARAAGASGSGELDLAIRIFQHLIDFYDYKQIDDLYYFQAELYYNNNSLLQARQDYRKIIDDFPASKFYPGALYRLMLIDYLNLNYSGMDEYFDLYAQNMDKNWSGYDDKILFMAASADYQLGNYDQAVWKFKSIDDSSPYYFRARFLTGDCLFRMGENKQALDYLKPLTSDKSKSAKKLKEQTAALIGDIFLVENNTETAYYYYNAVTAGSEPAPHALIGQGMIFYLREDYDKAENLADNLLAFYSDNNYFYQGLSLKALCRLKMNDCPGADKFFNRILNHSGNKIWMAKLNIEKLKLLHMLNLLKSMDEEFLAAGDEDLYTDYWKFRLYIEKKLNDTKLAVVLKFNPEMAGYMEERAKVYELIRECTELCNNFLEYKDFNLDYLKLEDMELMSDIKDFQYQLVELNAMVKQGGEKIIKSMPYLYNTAVKELNQASLDSLYETILAELAQYETELETARSMLKLNPSAEAVYNDGQLLMICEDIRQWRERLDLRTSETFADKTPVDDIDIKRWGDVAFHKLIIPGEDFTDLQIKRDRIKAVDEYIKRLDEIVRNLADSAGK
ncbi:MAG: hypothetical protein H8E87_06580, partial [FCB group bacterium]|nr:hypothetical protein [FCB group bacterium]